MYNQQYYVQQSQYMYNQPQPNPIGNVIGIGNNGYNNMGGYYSNNYNNFYNPYLAMQQQKIQEAQMREMQKQQSGIYKRISRSVNRALGNDIDEDYLNKRYDYNTSYNNPNQLTEDQMEDIKMNQLIDLYYNPQSYCNYENLRFIEMSNRIHDRNKQQFPDDTSLYDFMENSYKLYGAILDEQLRHSQRNLSKLYNSKQYNELIQLHSNGTGYFNTVFNNGMMNNNSNIDDMEIRMPSKMQDMYKQRRQAFLDSIRNSNY